MSADRLYQDLAPGNIRLLDIAAARGEEALHGHLYTVDLSSKPKFTALSYVWRDKEISGNTTLHCQGTALELTSNCYTALYNLRQKLGSFTIWVDAICINQKNEEEKSIQVALMGDIYSQAQFVYIWLGPSTASSERVMEYLSTAGLQRFLYRRPSSTTPRQCQDMVPSLPYFEPKTRPRDSSMLSEPSSDIVTKRWLQAILYLCLSWMIPYWHPFPFTVRSLSSSGRRWPPIGCYVFANELVDLLDHQYLRRVWTYQEMLLASRPVIVVGATHLAWSDFTSALLFLSKTSTEKLTNVVDMWERVAFDRERLSATDLYERDAFTRRVWSYYLLLSNLVWTSCVYAGLGLIAFSLWALIANKGKSIRAGVGSVLLCIGIFLFILGASLISLVYRHSGTHDRPAKRYTESLPVALFYRVSSKKEDMAYGVWAILQRRHATLPPVRYDIPLQDLYYLLTSEILKVTHSMDVLTLAADVRMLGCPSWVPQWYAKSEEAFYIPDDVEDRSRLTPRLTTKARLRYHIKDERQTLRWSLSGEILTVEGHDIGYLSSCISFAETADDHSNDDESSHLLNHQAMIEYAHWLEGCKGAIRDLLVSCWVIGAYDKVPQKWTEWARELQYEQVSWEDRSKSFKQCQIELCSALAKHSLSICIAYLGGRPCLAYSRHAQKGDRVIRVKSLLDPLVMRGVGPCNAVKVVGPFRQQGGDWWDTVPKLRPNDILFDDYHIS